MISVVFLRHGQTDNNSAGRFQGHADIPLNAVGASQAAAAAEHFRDASAPIERIISSDLQRAQQTAAALGRAAGVPVETDHRLREVDVGEWSGLLRSEVAERWPDEYAAWRGGFDMRMPGGEAAADVGRRGAAAVRDAVSHAEGSGRLVFVAHGALILRTASELLGLRLGSAGRLGSVQNCHWSSLRCDDDGRWVLDEWNMGVR